ncbi:unnamed protein product [Durusdinium trenchii]|uniref:WDHD1/CFT4 second beta-propeller domain-containing protein n=1 Tax=Durusdinium trenchii TaxID=1381693 RepID=A0ABP0I8C0_9DINO
MAGEVDPPVTESVFAQAVLAAAPHGGSCEVLRLAEGKLWTSGADGRLACSSHEGDTLSRNWAQKISKRLDSPTAAISLDGRLLAVAEETQAGFQVWVHELDAKGRMSLQKPRNAGRFTLNIRHLSWHQTLPYLCISTDDGKLDVWWEESQGSSTTASRRQLLKGLEGGVRCAALDPQSKLLAAAFTSGQLVILSFPEAAEKYRSTLWPKSVSGSGHLRLSWQPNGKRLALPGLRSLRLLPRDFGEVQELTGGHRYSTTMAVWSPSGEVLASASLEAVALWSNDCLQRIFEFKVEPSSFAWGGQLLAVGTKTGQVALLPALVHTDTANTTTGPSEKETKEEVAEVKEAEETKSADAEPSTPLEKRTELFQPAVQMKFQPGSTHRGRRRLLAWNEHGCLKLVIGSKHRLVEVDYYKCRDPSSLREIKADGVEIGALGPGLCALASSRHVAVHWAQSSFEHLVPDGQCAQPEVEPQLHFALFDLQKNDKICGCLPISPHSTLRWIGFSAEEQPLTLDSGGVLRAMLSTSSKSWIPVAEVGHECKLWPVEAGGGVLRCMEVRAGEEPQVAAQRLTTVPYNLPVGFESDAAAGALLKQLVRSKRGRSRSDAFSLQLFEEHVKLKDQELAYDVARCYLTQGSEQLSLARSMAEKSELHELALKLSQLIEGGERPAKRRLGS